MQLDKHAVSPVLDLVLGLVMGLALSLVLSQRPSFALQTYPLVNHQRTSIPISQTEQNRIAVLGDRIQQVFGAEGSFELQSDDEGGQIFLKLVPGGVSKPSTLTLITESGLTQDLRLIPKRIESQSVVFKPQLLSQEDSALYRRTGQAGPRVDPGVRFAPGSSLHAIVTLLKAMVKNESIPGYTRTSSQEPPHSSPVVEEDSPTIEALITKQKLAKKRGCNLFSSLLFRSQAFRSKRPQASPPLSLQGRTMGRKRLHPYQPRDRGPSLKGARFCG